MRPLAGGREGMCEEVDSKACRGDRQKNFQAERSCIWRMIHQNAARITAQQNSLRVGQYEVTQELPGKFWAETPQIVNATRLHG